MKYPLVYCEWEDIQSADAAWGSLDDKLEDMENTNSVVHQSGFQIEKTSDYVIIVCSYFDDQDLVGTLTRIPTSNIRKYEVVKE
jgi:hypothetical protein